MSAVAFVEQSRAWARDLVNADVRGPAIALVAKGKFRPLCDGLFSEVDSQQFEAIE